MGLPSPSNYPQTTLSEGATLSATLKPSRPYMYGRGGEGKGKGKDEGNEFQLTICAEPGNWRVPVIVRLRHFLKTARRCYGLRAVSVTPANPGGDKGLRRGDLDENRS